MKAPDITVSEWRAALDKSNSERVDVVPKDWKTMDQLAADLNCSIVHARTLINPLIGKTVDRKKFRVELRSGGGLRLVYHYRLK